MILIQQYIDSKLVDNWYLKDTVYPGTILYNDYNEALLQAAEETYRIETTAPNTQEFVAHVILCHETPKVRKANNAFKK